MRFDTFTSRFDDGLIQNLLGEAALKLLTAIDPTLNSRTKLLALAIDLYTPAGLLLDKSKRNAMFDLLHPQEAADLVSILNLSKTVEQLYDFEEPAPAPRFLA